MKNCDAIQNYFSGLDRFGKVELNEKKSGKYFVKITEGFKTNASNCQDLFCLILKSIPEEENRLVIEKFITDNNLYYLILKPKQ